MQPVFDELIMIGPLPTSEASIAEIQRWQELLEQITRPLTDDEAIALADLFPDQDDSCFGLAWTMIHLIETAPHRPIQCNGNSTNPWIGRLRDAVD